MLSLNIDAFLPSISPKVGRKLFHQFIWEHYNWNSAAARQADVSTIGAKLILGLHIHRMDVELTAAGDYAGIKYVFNPGALTNIVVS